MATAIINLNNNIDSGQIIISFYVDHDEIVIVSVNNILAEDLCCGYYNRIKKILAGRLNDIKKA